MKKIALLLSVLLMTSASQALSLAPAYYVSVLNSFETNHEQLKNALDGSVVIDYVKNEIQLNVSIDQNFCLESFACPAVYLEPKLEIISLPLIKTYKGWCGSTAYVAQLDKMPLDGMLQTIEVHDFTTLECKIFVALENMTEVTYSTLNPWTNQTTVSLFTGSALEGNAVFFKNEI